MVIQKLCGNLGVHFDTCRRHLSRPFVKNSNLFESDKFHKLDTFECLIIDFSDLPKEKNYENLAKFIFGRLLSHIFLLAPSCIEFSSLSSQLGFSSIICNKIKIGNLN